MYVCVCHGMSPGFGFLVGGGGRGGGFVMVFCGVGSFGFLPSSLLPVMFLSFCGLGNWATILRERERERERGSVTSFCRWMEQDIRREMNNIRIIR